MLFRSDFYMPGRDHSAPVEAGGKWLLVLSLLGALAHGAGRLISGWKNGEKE